MVYKTKTVVVEAFQMTAPMVVDDVLGSAGDWLIIGANGKGVIYNDAYFRQYYELADSEDVPARFQQERKPRRPNKPREPKVSPLYGAVATGQDEVPREE